MRGSQAFLLGAVFGALVTGLGFLLTDDGPVPTYDVGQEGGGAFAPTLRASPQPNLVGRGEAGPRTARNAAVDTERAHFVDEFRNFYRDRTSTEPSADTIAQAWRERQERVAMSTHETLVHAVRRHEDCVLKARLESRDDAVALLSDPERQGELREIRNDARALEALLAPRSSGPTRDGPDVLETDDAMVAAGTTLQFPAGIWTVEAGRLRSGGKYPADLTIEGAGMNRTLLRFDGFRPKHILWNLHLRDCTIDCGNGCFLDQRFEPGAVRVERVRFVRFDAGTSMSCVFAVSRAAAIYCSDCTFAGGYGEAPGKGNVVSKERLARFERCVFERIDYQHYGPATALDSCVFRDCAGATVMMESATAAPKESASFVKCTVEWTLPIDEIYDMESKRRELHTLFSAVR